MKRDADLSVAGKPHPRVEGAEKVSGWAKYSSDIQLPQQLYAKVLRSPLPHARIARIDPSKAEALRAAARCSVRSEHLELPFPEPR